MPRYVLLRHACPSTYRVGSHWDFMLEEEGVLWAWSLCRLPATWRERLSGADRASAEIGGCAYSEDSIEVDRLADHRLEYLYYEGPVSGDRGEVSRIASGEFRWLAKRTDQLAIKFATGLLSGVAIVTGGRLTSSEKS